jgi:hypothetical protein
MCTPVESVVTMKIDRLRASLLGYARSVRAVLRRINGRTKWKPLSLNRK